MNYSNLSFSVSIFYYTEYFNVHLLVKTKLKITFYKIISVAM